MHRTILAASVILAAGVVVFLNSGSAAYDKPAQTYGRPFSGKTFLWDSADKADQVAPLVEYTFADPMYGTVTHSVSAASVLSQSSLQEVLAMQDATKKPVDDQAAQREKLESQARELREHAARIENAKRELEEARKQLEAERRELHAQFEKQRSVKKDAPGHEDPKAEEGERMMQHLRLLHGMAEHLADPHAAAMLGITFAREELEPEQRIAVMRAVLEEVDQPPAVRNAAMLVLIHTLNELGHESDVQKLLAQFIIENAKRVK